jgi:hypothetical protein
MTLLVATNLANNAWQTGQGGLQPGAEPYDLYVPLTNACYGHGCLPH